LTLQQLSKKTGFSHGHLSKIENSKKAPPVSTLLKLAKALGVGISALFGEEEDPTPVTLVRRDERKQLARDATRFGYSYQMLAPSFLNKKMDPYILVIPPDLEDLPFFQHEGQEMIFVLEGQGVLVHGERELTFEEGDCLYFDASVPHLGKAIGGKRVVLLVVIWSP
jgi:transcriptional regulator with XRE-family HTH domain